MEVVGLVVAVGSMAKAGSVALKFASKIRKVAKEAGTVGQRIEQSASTFYTFGTVIDTTIFSIQQYCPQTEDESEDSPVIKYMKANGLLESFHSQSCMIRNDILTRQEEICSVITEWGPRTWREFKTSWNWAQMEKTIMNLHPKMDMIKSNVMLTLNIIIFEAVVAKNKRHPSLEHEKQIEVLKNHIVELIDVIRHLRKDLGHMRVPVSVPNGSVRSLSPPVDPLKVICHLGHSLVERDAVPTEPPESFSFKEAKRSRQYRRRHSRQFQSNNPHEVPSPAPPEQIAQPRSSGTSSPGPRPSPPHPEKPETDSQSTRSISPDKPRRATPYRFRRVGQPDVYQLQPVDTRGEDHDLSDSESRSRRTESPRPSTVTAKEVPTPREDYSTDTQDTEKIISRVANVVEPETLPKHDRPTLKPLRQTESAQALPGETSNARTRRANRKQRQSSATVSNSDISARYGNVKPRPRPRSPPKSEEDTSGDIGHTTARSLRSSTTAADKPNGTLESETLERKSQNLSKGVIDPPGVGDIDHDIRRSRSSPKQKESSQTRHLGITVQTEPTPPQTPISPIFAPSSPSASSSSSSPSSAPRSQVIPQPRRQPPNPPGQPTASSQTRKNSTKNEIQTAYIINPKTGIKTPFQVHIDRKYIKNLITLSYTRKLEIGVVYQAHREVFQYHGTEISLVGSARLQWSTVPGNTLVEPGSVEVDVCEDSEELEHQLVFGQWFVGARKSLSSEEAKEDQVLDV